MGRPQGSSNAQTEIDASLLWHFVDQYRPTKAEIKEGLGFGGAKVSRLSKFLAREMNEDIIIPPSKPTAEGRWEYRTSFDAQISAEWVSWSLKHVASRAKWISEVSVRLGLQFPEVVMYQVIAATAAALQTQADAARNAL